MPPQVPIYVFDFKGKSRIKGVSESRAGSFFAEIPLKHVREFSESDFGEFGKVVYGPARERISEAQCDFIELSGAASKGPGMLRRAICKLAHLGGTRSHPNPAVKPVLAGAPKINVNVVSNDAIVINGIRRSNVSASIPSSGSELLMERILDISTDLLSCAVDSQLGISPPVADLVDAIKFAVSREGVSCPLSEQIVQECVIPLIYSMKDYAPWASLHEPKANTDDAQVIHGFLTQFRDKARQADQHGEKKQLKRVRREVRKRKKEAHTIFVLNLPRETTEAELFQVFNQSANAVYKATIPKDAEGYSKGFGFVICRSRKATESILQRYDWEVGGRRLYVKKAANDPEEEEAEPKRQRTNSSALFRLPSSLEDAVVKVVSQHPGCNVSQIPNLVRQVVVDEPLDPQKYGFRNLSHALQSVSSIYLEPAKSGSARRPVYFAYPK